MDRNDKMAEVMPERYWHAIEHVNKGTISQLNQLYQTNIRANLGLWKKHGAMADGLYGFGKNKAVINIGAGSSLKKNLDVLQRVSDFNLMKKLDDQPFIFVVCNHSFKPMLEQGVYPHFVSLVDGSDVVFDQLCRNVPEKRNNTILLAPLSASPKVLKEWDRQGRTILFHVGKADEVQQFLKNETGEDFERYGAEEGGNVTNTVWVWSMRWLKSSVHMVVGNDLSFPLTASVDSRRNSYYADGDYTSNINNKRDEAKSRMAWMGFEYEFNPILNKWVVNFKPVATAWQLWTYKTWIEMQITMHEKSEQSWHYFNCSEQGISGMVPKEDSKDVMMNKDNWQLMDQLTPRRWHTRRLEDAINQFLQARDMICGETNIAAPYAIN